MRTHYTVKVTLTLEGPLLTSGSEMSDVGIDAPMARDRYERFMLPFSLIKGKVLDALRDLKTDNEWLQEWLGGKPDDGTFEPERGRLRFGDFSSAQLGRSDNVIERIKLDGDTGAVAGQMLLMIQAPFTYGEEATFQGEIEFIASEREADEVQKRLELALRWTPAFGAYRTVGFGRTLSVKTELIKTASRSSGTPKAASSIPWQLKLDRPLCLVGRRHSQNHFESLEVISGTVLKGAVAQMLQDISGSKGRDVSSGVGADFLNLRRHFSNIRFGEVRPRKVMKGVSSARPVQPPLSVVTCPVKQDDYFDVALDEQAELIHGAAPAFMPDWKGEDFAAVHGPFGWSLLPRERRTRTAIDETTGRAKDEQLFSYGLVLPDRGRWDPATKSFEVTEGFVWEGNIGLEGVTETEQAAVRTDLAALLAHGIVGLGKTRAVGEVTWLDGLPAPAIMSTPWSLSAATADSRMVVITLQTECLMTNPDTLTPDETNPLEAAYQDFWRELSNSSLRLVRFFARQSLYGGFVSQRVKASHNGNYEPFLLTDRGSVFVLEFTTPATPETAHQLLDQWEQQGLCNAGWLMRRYGTPLWQHCSYIRENGYGEIAINLACHFQNRIQQELRTTGESA